MHVTQPPKTLLAQVCGRYPHWLTVLSHRVTPTLYCRLLGMTEHLGRPSSHVKMSQSAVLDMTCFPFFSSLLAENPPLFSSTEPLSSFPPSSYGDDTAENMARLLQWLQKSLSLERPGRLCKKLASYQRPSQHIDGFPRHPAIFKVNLAGPRTKSKGCKNELFLINPTCKTEENLKIPQIQGRHSN